MIKLHQKIITCVNKASEVHSFRTQKFCVRLHNDFVIQQSLQVAATSTMAQDGENTVVYITEKGQIYFDRLDPKDLSTAREPFGRWKGVSDHGVG